MRLSRATFLSWLSGAWLPPSASCLPLATEYLYVIDRRDDWFDPTGHVVLAHVSVGVLLVSPGLFVAVAWLA